MLSLCLALLSAAPLLSLEDPRGDDYGPGTYTYPSGSQFQRGDFDLRKVELRVSRDHLIIEVTFGAQFRRPNMVRKTHAGEIRLEHEIYVQNIDLYIDREPGGLRDALPGRKVRFSAAQAWDVAVLITPRPHAARSALSSALEREASRVVVATDIRSQGSTVRVRIPIGELGAVPSPSWGYALMVTGASWDPSFQAVDRLAGDYAASVFALPVFAIPEEEAFGGGPVSGMHPHVIDLLTAHGRDQRGVLAEYGNSPGEFATVPMIYPQVPRRAALPRLRAPVLAPPSRTSSAARGAPLAGPSQIVFRVGDVQGADVVIPDPDGVLQAWQMGEILDADGSVVGRIVVTAVHPGFALGRSTDGEGRLAAGARVRFQRKAGAK